MFLGNGSTLSGKSIRVGSAILNKTINNSILPTIKEVPMESISLGVIEGIHQLVAGLVHFLNLEDCLEKLYCPATACWHHGRPTWTSRELGPCPGTLP